jgi:signal transduction histidine kinase
LVRQSLDTIERQVALMAVLVNDLLEFSRVKVGKFVLRVADTGGGMAQDVLPSVFGMFSQVDETLDRSRGGLGIGLALARQLVELHGGTLEAASNGRGQGSVFTVRLPLADEQPLAKPPREVARA